uniref:AAA+ ATPase domain-containing protein n=1 Tax=Meloidogyne incognita TaxID=6306 RepID=A0A914KKY3_MELIC
MNGFEHVDFIHTLFKHPFTMIVSGSTGSGKSEWVKKLLENLNEMTSENISMILYCYGELNSNILQMQRKGLVGDIRATVHAAMPNEDFIKRQANGMLLILDDLMVGVDPTILETIFTRGSHNWKMSVILSTQHLFCKELRIPRNNSHYLVLMRNPAGSLQIKNLATQLFPSRSKYFLEAYADATKEMYGYLLVDLHPSTPEKFRLRTHIYNEKLTIVYVPK